MPSPAPATLTLARGDEQFAVGERLPVLPLRDMVVFPYVVTPLVVGRPASLAAVQAAAAEQQFILLVAQRSAEVLEPAAADLFRIGVAGRVLQIARTPNGTTKVLVEGVARARVTRYAPADKYLRATIAPLPFRGRTAEADEHAMSRRVVTLFEEYVGLHRRLPSEVVSLVQGTDA